MVIYVLYVFYELACGLGVDQTVCKSISLFSAVSFPLLSFLITLREKELLLCLTWEPDIKQYIW